MFTKIQEEKTYSVDVFIRNLQINSEKYSKKIKEDRKYYYVGYKVIDNMIDFPILYIFPKKKVIYEGEGIDTDIKFGCGKSLVYKNELNKRKMKLIVYLFEEKDVVGKLILDISKLRVIPEIEEFEDDLEFIENKERKLLPYFSDTYPIYSISAKRNVTALISLDVRHRRIESTHNVTFPKEKIIKYSYESNLNKTTRQLNQSYNQSIRPKSEKKTRNIKKKHKWKNVKTLNFSKTISSSNETTKPNSKVLFGSTRFSKANKSKNKKIWMPSGPVDESILSNRDF